MQKLEYLPFFLIAFSFSFFFFLTIFNILCQSPYSTSPDSDVKFDVSLFAYNTQCTMQYVPSLLPITGLSQSLTPHPSEALSLFLIVHSLSCIFFFLKILFVHFCKKGIDRANVVGGEGRGRHHLSAEQGSPGGTRSHGPGIMN